MFNEPHYLLLKEATKKKRQGDFDGAIACLRQAIVAAIKAGGGLPIKELLRLPKYLAEAGKRDEAWGEYNKLIVKLSQEPTDLFSLYLGYYEIHHAMSLHVKKEKRFKDMVIHELMSFIYFGLSRYGYYAKEMKEIKRLEQEGIFTKDDELGLKKSSQKFASDSYEEGKSLLSPKAVDEFLDSILEEAGLEGVRSKIAEVLKRHFSMYPNIKVNDVVKDVHAVCR